MDRGNIRIILLMIPLLIISVAAVYLYIKPPYKSNVTGNTNSKPTATFSTILNNPKISVSTPSASVFSTTLPSPTPLIIKDVNRSGWKRYVNKEAGFEVSFPQNWIFDVMGGIDGLDIHLWSKDYDLEDNRCSIKGYAALEIQKGGSWETSESFDEYVKSQVKPESVMGLAISGKLEKIKINNYDAYKVQHSGWDMQCPGPGYFIKQNDKTYSYVFTGGYKTNGISSSEPDDQVTLLKIINSITFTK